MVAPATSTVYLARHGQTVLNADGRLRGRLDPPLDDVGRFEVQRLGKALAQQLSPDWPERIVTSPLARAVETAHAILDCTGGAILVDDRLTDRDYGQWAGQTRDQIESRWQTIDAAPGVEPAMSVLRRVRAAVDEHLRATHAPVIFVAHDAVNRLLLASLDPRLGPADDIPQRTACWNLLHRDGNGLRVDLVDQHG